MVSPLAAADTQSLTSAALALAAVRVGLDPEQAAAAGRAKAQTTHTSIATRRTAVRRPRLA
jgi:hypothetical protein